MPAERRDAPRIPYVLEAMLSNGEHGFQPCKTRDISMNGVFVLTRDGSLQRDDSVELSVKVPAAAKPMQHFHAQIVHAGPDGVGLLFDHTTIEGYVPLLRLVYAKRKLPELL
ncbi:MAG: PilZ domain-containing protein [Acidiferrobacterales bacterium]